MRVSPDMIRRSFFAPGAFGRFSSTACTWLGVVP
jgi:hypothetical protein